MSEATVTGNSNTTNVIQGSTGSRITDGSPSTTTASSTSTTVAMSRGLKDNFTTKIEIVQDKNMEGGGCAMFKPAFALVQKDTDISFINAPGEGIHHVFPQNFDATGKYNPVGSFAPGAIAAAAWPSASLMQSYGYPIVGATDFDGKLNYDVSWAVNRQFKRVEELHYICAPHQPMQATIQVVGNQKLADGSYVRVVVSEECPLLAGGIPIEYARIGGLTAAERAAEKIPSDASSLSVFGDDKFYQKLFAKINTGYMFGVQERIIIETSGGTQTAKFYVADLDLQKYKLKTTMTWNDEVGCYANDRTAQLEATKARPQDVVTYNHTRTGWEFFCVGSQTDTDSSKGSICTGTKYADSDEIKRDNLLTTDTMTAFGGQAGEASYNSIYIDNNVELSVDLSNREYFRGTFSMLSYVKSNSHVPENERIPQKMWYLGSETKLSSALHIGRDVSYTDFSGGIDNSTIDNWKDYRVPGNVYKVQKFIPANALFDPTQTDIFNIGSKWL